MAGGAGRARHILSFGLTGLGSFAVDLAVLLALRHGLGLSPLLARVPAIATAMVFGWLCNRRFTFRIAGPPRLAEFLRYAAASGLAVAVNYLTFAVLLLALPRLALAAAAFGGSVVAAGVSYLGYRHFAFRPARRAPPP